jgi:hypothetical protein
MKTINKQKYFDNLPTCNFFDVFKDVDLKDRMQGGYWVRHSNIAKMSAYLELKPRAYRLIERMKKHLGGVIYSLSTEAYFFEVVDNGETRTLYLRYDQIIGSRALCRIRNTDFDAVRRRINRATALKQ